MVKLDVSLGIIVSQLFPSSSLDGAIFNSYILVVT